MLGRDLVSVFKRFATRLCLLVIGALVGLLLCEFAMRGAGYAIRWDQDRRNALAVSEKHDLVVLCIGESTTEGSFEGGSYPEMLQQILNQAGVGIRFAVMNAGLAGAISEDVIAEFERRLAERLPDIVVSMIGINDSGRTHVWGDVIEPGRGRWYGGWRLYKLYRLLRVGPPPRGGEGPPLVPVLAPAKRFEAEAMGPPPRATPTPADEMLLRKIDALYGRLSEEPSAHVIPSIEDLRGEYPTSSLVVSLLADAYSRQGEGERSHELLQDAYERLPHAGVDLVSRLALSYADRKEYDRAIALAAYASAVLVNPRVAHDVTHYRLMLAGFYERAGRDADAEVALRLVAESINPGKDATYRPLIDFLERKGRRIEAERYQSEQLRVRHEYVNPATRENYIRLYRLARRHDLPLLAMQYPKRSLESLRRFFPQSEGVTFVGNDFFDELILRHGHDRYFTDHFAGDLGHFSQITNCIVATRVAGAILRQVLQLDVDEGSALGQALTSYGCALSSIHRGDLSS